MTPGVKSSGIPGRLSNIGCLFVSDRRFITAGRPDHDQARMWTAATYRFPSQTDRGALRGKENLKYLFIEAESRKEP